MTGKSRISTNLDAGFSASFFYAEQNSDSQSLSASLSWERSRSLRPTADSGFFSS